MGGCSLKLWVIQGESPLHGFVAQSNIIWEDKNPDSCESRLKESCARAVVL